MIEFGHGTHVGLRRARNEDTYYADASLGLFLVADGMGGHRHGEVASALVRDTLVDLITRGHSLAESIRRADERLLAHARQCQQGLPMGTTIAALRLQGHDYETAWVGDSRIYLHQGELQQVSHDQALAEPTGAAPAAARTAQRKVITQALGITAADQLQISQARGQVRPGSCFLLCTDGLAEELDTPSLERVVARRDLAAQECVDHLLLGALDRGGSDNITAILVRLN